MKPTNLVGIFSTVILVFLLVFSLSYSYEEIYGHAIDVGEPKTVVEYSFQNITVSVNDSIVNNGLIPASVSYLGHTAEVAADDVINFVVTKTLNFSELYSVGYPFANVSIPVNLSGSLTALVFQKVSQLINITVNITKPFSGITINLTRISGNEYHISGNLSYLWNGKISLPDPILVDGATDLGSLAIKEISGTLYHIFGNVTLSGTGIYLEFGKLKIAMQTVDNNLSAEAITFND
ncbi:MAG: hypothetical protein M1454_00760 [Candidatus Thermoplasmatota archaeon]|nr:hypothetical protein [Candidatus Thermoplasmatota archaeon]MCL5730860.1 hypothetical protein [Candidatus Thermoplasmatota archaeon]